MFLELQLGQTDGTSGTGWSVPGEEGEGGGGSSGPVRKWLSKERVKFESGAEKEQLVAWFERRHHRHKCCCGCEGAPWECRRFTGGWRISTR